MLDILYNTRKDSFIKLKIHYKTLNLPLFDETFRVCSILVLKHYNISYS